MVERFVVRLEESTANGLVSSGTFDAKQISITDDGKGIAKKLAHLLNKAGIKNISITNEVKENDDMVICLDGLKEVKSIDEAVAINRQVFSHSKKIADSYTDKGGIFISVQDCGGDFGFNGKHTLNAWFGGLAGLVKTAAQEWPKASCKAIDINTKKLSVNNIAKQIAEEIMSGGQDLEVALNHNKRFVPKLVKEQPEISNKHLPKNPVIIAAGGARGVTAVTLIDFAKKYKAKIAMLGRSIFDITLVEQYATIADTKLQASVLMKAKQAGEKLTPKLLQQQVNKILANREIAHTLAAIKKAGGDAQYIAVDVQDKKEVKNTINAVRKSWLRIDGIVHGAGVLADALISNKTLAQFDRVFTTKISGLRALLEATEKDNLSFYAMFSSVAARAGNPGQCDYSMANEILNKVACAIQHKHPKAIVKSYNWGPWEGGMVTAQLKALFEQRGIALIPLQQGAHFFVDEIGFANDVEIVVGGSSLTNFGKQKSLTAQIGIDLKSHPYLIDHQVKQVPVLPMVLVLEWFIRMAKLLHPTWRFAICRDFKVLKGVRLEHLKQGHWFTINAKDLTNGRSPTVELQLLSQENLLYSGQVIMVEGVDSQLNKQQSPQLEDGKWRKIYTSERLFHGPEFQVLTDLKGISDKGIALQMTGTSSKGWSGGPWHTDAAALDGGLQAAILWGLHVIGEATIPMKIDEFVPLCEEIPKGELYCVLHGRTFNKQKTVSDILITQQDGSLVAELHGVEMYAVPSSSK